MPTASDPYQRLTSQLRLAMGARDRARVSALRAAIAAIDNARAVPGAEPGTTSQAGPHFAGAVAGLGAAEVTRRELTPAEQAMIIYHEATERRSAAARFGSDDPRAQALLQGAEALDEVIADSDSGDLSD